MHLLEGILRRAIIDDGHPEAMTTGPMVCSEPLQMAIFIDGFIGFGHG
jgi:hypothetical protein